jgi:hypothetical protein
LQLAARRDIDVLLTLTRHLPNLPGKVWCSDFAL